MISGHGRGDWKRSGLEWVPTVPRHWGLPPLGALFDVQLGKMLNPDATAGPEPRPYLRNVNVQWDKLVLDDVAEMHFDAADRARYRLRGGDLLVCEGGEVGRAAVWIGELDECYYQKALHRVRPRGADSTRFLMYALMAAASMGVFDNEGNTSTIVHLTAEKLRAHRFPWPPLAEQRAIADYLDAETARIDQIVQRLTQANLLLDEWLAAEIETMIWSANDPQVPLMHLTPSSRQIQYGIVLPGPDVPDGVPIVKGGNIATGNLQAGGLARTTYRIEVGFARSRLRRNDIVFAIRGAVGACAMVPEEVEGANITQDIARVSPLPSVDPAWLLYALRSRSLQQQVESRIVGATIRGVNIRDLKRVRVPLPTPPTQGLRAKALEEAQAHHDEVRARRRLQIGLLAERRQALITAAVTGQLDIPGVAV